MRGSYTVEVDIFDFDEETILDAANSIRGRGRGLTSPLDGGPPTPQEHLSALINDLAASIASGNQIEALRRLDDLVGDDRALRDAIDIGRRRRR